MTLHPIPYTKISVKRKNTSSGDITLLGARIQKRDAAPHSIDLVSTSHCFPSLGVFCGTPLSDDSVASSPLWGSQGNLTMPPEAERFRVTPCSLNGSGSSVTLAPEDEIC